MIEEPGQEAAPGGKARRSRRSFGKRFRVRLFRYWRGLFDFYRPERHYMRGSPGFAGSAAPPGDLKHPQNQNDPDRDRSNG